MGAGGEPQWGPESGKFASASKQIRGYFTLSYLLYPPTKLSGFASISETASGKSGVDMSAHSTPGRHPCI